MKFPLITFTVLTAILTACGSPQIESADSKSSSAADIIVRATSDLEAPASIVEVTFVPNSVATWLGHIIMIDKNADLYRSTTDSKVKLIDEGDYKSVFGIARVKQPGVFLAVTKSGSLKAFIESDDDGNFKALPISINPDTRLTKFCQNAVPSQNKLWALNKDGAVKGFNVVVTDNASVALEPLAKDIIGNNKNSTTCAALTYDADKSLTLDKTTPHLLMSAGEESKTISITNGLSIRGISNPGYVGITTANMGSVYSGGVILTSEKNSGRIVLIARDYFVGAVSE